LRELSKGQSAWYVDIALPLAHALASDFDCQADLHERKPGLCASGAEFLAEGQLVHGSLGTLATQCIMVAS
jgi:hypothetical protein